MYFLLVLPLRVDLSELRYLSSEGKNLYWGEQKQRKITRMQSPPLGDRSTSLKRTRQLLPDWNYLEKIQWTLSTFSVSCSLSHDSGNIPFPCLFVCLVSEESLVFLCLVLPYPPVFLRKAVT